MRRRAVLLAMTGLALGGCKAFEKEKDHAPADAASRTKGKGNQGWLGGPSPGLGKVGTPPADSWGDPRDPLYDVKREVQSVLAGFVEDPDGRKVKDAFIEVEPVGGGGDGAPVGVQTDRSGYFLIKGLKPAQTYQLTATTKAEGRELAARVFAKTGTDRSQFIRLALIEGLNFPGSTNGKDLPIPAPGTIAPPPVIPSGSGKPEPISRSSEDGTGLVPKATSDQAPPKTVTVPARPDLMADKGDTTWKPPAASVPTTVIPPVVKKPELRNVPPEARFALLDTLGVQRDFPSGRPGDLVVLTFLTTTGLPSKQSMPIVKDIQARYGLKGVEVVGVVCDTSDSTQRRVLGAAYQRAESLNFLLYAETTKDPGPAMKKFNVKLIPTLVLIDGNGAVLWTGKPADNAELEKVIVAELAKPK